MPGDELHCLCTFFENSVGLVGILEVHLNSSLSRVGVRDALVLRYWANTVL